MSRPASTTLKHIASRDHGGGALRAAYRLHEELLRQGTDSRMLVGDRASEESSILKVPRSRSLVARWQRASLRLRRSRQKLGPLDDARSFWTNELVGALPDEGAIALHWSADFLDYAHFFPAMAQQRRALVWRLADMLPLTGGCFYSEGCTRFTQHCGVCPQLGSSDEADASAQILRRKAKAFGALADDQLVVVCPSQWMLQCSQSSRLLGRFRHVHLPTGVSLDYYQPRDAAACRQALGLDASRTVVALAADNLSESRKGLDLFWQAWSSLDEHTRPVVLLAGTWSKGVPRHEDVRTLGYIQDSTLLTLIFNAADVTIHPAREDNQPNTVLESFACGTPVAAFATSGMPELIGKDELGWLLRPTGVEALRAFLADLPELAGSTQLREKGEAARATVEKRHNIAKQAEAFRTHCEEHVRSLNHSDSGRL